MKPCQVEWQKLVIQGKKSILLKRNQVASLKIKQNVKSTCIYRIRFKLFAFKYISLSSDCLSFEFIGHSMIDNPQLPYMVNGGKS